MWDVAIIGAGLTGLTCARQLKAAGYQVCLIDKSKGLGGRMATRRVTGPVRVDHGLRYWSGGHADGVLQPLTHELIAEGVLKPWSVTSYELRAHDELVSIERGPVYVASNGISAIAKYLAQDFVPEETLLMGYHVNRISPYSQSGSPSGSQSGDEGWRIECEDSKIVMAKRCAIAIPAPQAAELLKRCPPETFENALEGSPISALQKVQYDPCLTVLAGYSDQPDMGKLPPDGWMVTDTVGTSTDWIGLDSSKRTPPYPETTLVIHSRAFFAERYANSNDLQPAASVLLRANARKFGDWIAAPNWFQIHRWRYAFVNQPYPKPILSLTPSFVGGGDWCTFPSTAHPITTAYLSGAAMAEALQFS
ncbi:MAG: FAD-dependent oxidoreductase [Phormidesmis sp.]